MKRHRIGKVLAVILLLLGIKVSEIKLERKTRRSMGCFWSAVASPCSWTHLFLDIRIAVLQPFRLHVNFQHTQGDALGCCNFRPSV